MLQKAVQLCSLGISPALLRVLYDYVTNPVPITEKDIVDLSLALQDRLDILCDVISGFSEFTEQLEGFLSNNPFG